jgi:cation diffusion facilitator CzcD-associated flavoprotein CzcO
VEECDLPYMPTPQSFPVYPTRQQYACYLDTYKDMVGLDVRNCTEVVSATREVDPLTGDVMSWTVVAHTLDRKRGSLTRSSFRCKHFCCTVGIYNQKKIPDFEGMAHFEGTIVHSSNYTNATDLGLKDKKVLVVGFGNSGAEICVDLVEHGAKPEVLVRSPVCIVPRDDMQALQSLLYTHGFLKAIPYLWVMTPVFVLGIDAYLKLKTYLAFGALENYNLRSVNKGVILRFISEFLPPMMDIGTISCIKDKKLKVIKDDIREFRKTSVLFADGTERDFDSCVMATGYEMATTHGYIVDPGTLREVGTGIGAVLSFNIKSGGESSAKGLWFLFGRLQNIRDDAPKCAIAIKRRLDGKKHKEGIKLIDRANRNSMTVNILKHIAFALCARAFTKAYPAYSPSRSKVAMFAGLWVLCVSVLGGTIAAGIMKKKAAAQNAIASASKHKQS